MASDFPPPVYTVFDAVRHIALRQASAADVKASKPDAGVFFDAQGRPVYLMCGLDKSLAKNLYLRTSRFS